MALSRSMLAAVGTFCLLVTAAGRPARAESRDHHEGSTTIEFPRDESVKVGLDCGPVTLRSVKVENAPSHDDVKKAHHDHDDTTRLHWIFKVDNEGKHKRKVKIHLTVYTEEDKVLAEDSREDTVSDHADGDHISVWTKIHTYKYPKAHHVTVAIECERD
jgi:hypothetical protein